jgi:hypothetical protein
MVWGNIQGLNVTANFRLTGHDDTQARNLLIPKTVWADTADSTFKARATFHVNDAGQPVNGRECLRLETDGSAAMLGFYGSAAVAQQSVTGSRGGNAALADLLTKLTTPGLIVDGASG